MSEADMQEVWEGQLLNDCQYGLPFVPNLNCIGTQLFLQPFICLGFTLSNHSKEKKGHNDSTMV